MDFKSIFSSMGVSARIGLYAGLGLLVVLTGALLWWAYSPREQLLFGNLREADAAEIVQSLNEWKIPHTISNGGSAISVAEDAVYETRMRLVSAGIPRGGHVGFELFDDSDFGVTEFAQRVNFQRALQGEIERTIAALPGVENARVHLTIRRPGLFVGDKESSKASVALTLRPGQTLSRQQIGGIRNLVAAAVEGLSASSVAILGSDGALLAAAGGEDGSADTEGRWEEKTQEERRIQGRIVELLRQVLRDEEFRVSVDVELNFDSVHEVSERPLGDGDVALARKSVSYAAADSSRGGGQNQEETEYLHGKARAEISRALGRIDRISVAVILPPHVDEIEVSRLRSLIEVAAGIDSARGDQLEVSRIGRMEALRDRRIPSISPARPVASAIAVNPDIGVGPYRKALSTSLVWKWLLVGGLGVLIGAIVGISLHQRPRALRQSERDAMLNRLKGWLAEGEASS